MSLTARPSGSRRDLTRCSASRNPSKQPRVAIATHFQRECNLDSRLRRPTLTRRLATDVFLNGILARQLPVFLARMEILIDDKGNDTASELPIPPASRSPQSDAVENVTYLYRSVSFAVVQVHGYSIIEASFED